MSQQDKDDDLYGEALRSLIDEIEPGFYIGNMWGRTKLDDKRIEVVLSILTDSERANLSPLPETMKEYPIGLDDSDKVSFELMESILDQTTSIITEARSAGKGVFVHCALGISRSATVVMDYIMTTRHFSFEQALEYLEQARYCVCPNHRFQKVLRKREADRRTKCSMM